MKKINQRKSDKLVPSGTFTKIEKKCEENRKMSQWKLGEKR